MSFLARFNALYSSHFDSNPTRTLVIANGTLSTISDIIAQTMTIAMAEPDEKPKYDPARTGRFAAFGLAMGPVVGKWLKILDRGFPMPQGGSFATIVKRVAADQAVMAPLGLVCFTGSMGIMEGKSMPELEDKFKAVYWPALTANWKVWPLIQSVNFGVVPLAYRLPFQQTCGIFWNVYLSLLNASHEKGHPEIVEELVEDTHL